MKYLFWIFCAVLNVGCAAKAINKQAMENNDTTNCPPNGTCITERLVNKGIEIKTSSSGGTYIEIIDKPDSFVVHYEYTRTKSPENYADDFHREEVYMEFPAGHFKKTLENSDLKEVKLIFGRHCYCKGYAGWFIITEGKVQIDHTDKQTEINLQFKAPVPQLFEKLHFTIQ